MQTLEVSITFRVGTSLQHKFYPTDSCVEAEDGALTGVCR